MLSRAVKGIITRTDHPAAEQTLFAVPMHCESCVKDISDTLYKLDGIHKVEADLKEQLVKIEGTGMSQ